jgi:two-component system nitrate/nitrite sensor histidine kinase NarX
MMDFSASSGNWSPYQCSQIACSTKQHADELETLLTIQQAVTSQLDLSDVLQLIADEARRLTSAQLSLLYVLEGDELCVSAVSGLEVSDDLLGCRIPVDRSIAGPSIKTGQPTMIAEIQSSDAEMFWEVASHFRDMHSYMTVPFMSGSQPIGIIAVANQGTEALALDNLRVLSMLAPSAVIGLENARLYQEQQERRLEAEGRQQMAEGLRVMLAIVNSNRSLDEILDYIVTHVSSRLLDCQAMAIFSLQAKDGDFKIQAAHGLPADLLAASHFLPERVSIKQAVLTRQPVAVADVSVMFGDETNSTPTEAALLSQLMTVYQAWLAVPLIIKGSIYGVILLYYQQPRKFSEQEIGLAQVFSDQVALAIENARLRMNAEQSAVAAERNRLARELHDAVSQTLFSTCLIADVLPRLWERDQSEGLQRLGELRQLTRGALAEMRTLLFELRPAAFNEAELGELLKHLTQGIAARARIPITLTVDGERALPPEVKVVFYRIAQEALNNVAKYAEPSQVTVSLCCQPEQVELTIADDGCGFDPASIAPGHLGVRIMQERAAAIHAVMELKSKADCGTQIKIAWSQPTPEEQT